MADEQQASGSAGFDQGGVSQSVLQTQRMITSWFNELDPKYYLDAYRRLALSGTTGALEALGKQQKGKSSKKTDPVNPSRFLADAWLGSVTDAWDASLDISREFMQDLAQYLGVDLQPEPKRAAAKKAAKKTTKASAKKATKASTKKAPAKKATKKTASKTAKKRATKTTKKTVAKATRTASART